MAADVDAGFHLDSSAAATFHWSPCGIAERSLLEEGRKLVNRVSQIITHSKRPEIKSLGLCTALELRHVFLEGNDGDTESGGEAASLRHVWKNKAFG